MRFSWGGLINFICSCGLSLLASRFVHLQILLGDSNSPVPLVSRSERTRCTSASSSTGQPLALSAAGGGLDSGPLGGPSIVGSLPSRGARILPATSPPNPVPSQTGSRLHQMRPIFSPSLYTSPGGVKHPSAASGRMTGKRTAAGRPPPTKTEESGVGIPVPKQSPMFSPGGGNTFGSRGGNPFAGLSISLPVRMASDEFPGAAELNTDEVSWSAYILMSFLLVWRRLHFLLT